MLYSFWDFSLSNDFHYEVSFLCSCTSTSVQEIEMEYHTSKKKEVYMQCMKNITCEKSAKQIPWPTGLNDEPLL